MKPAVTDDQLPTEIEIRRERRRTVELAMWNGRLVARVPRRMARRELDEAIRELRAGLNADLWRRRILDDQQLQVLARDVQGRWLGDLKLPPYEIRFSARMRKRWASCTVIRGVSGKIHVSRVLRGHPHWILEHILLHELIHLDTPNHGPRFQKLMRRSPHGERAEGYLEALEHQEQWGEWLCGMPDPPPRRTAHPRIARMGQIDLFESGEEH